MAVPKTWLRKRRIIRSRDHQAPIWVVVGLVGFQARTLSQKQTALTLVGPCSYGHPLGIRHQTEQTRTNMSQPFQRPGTTVDNEWHVLQALWSRKCHGSWLCLPLFDFDIPITPNYTFLAPSNTFPTPPDSSLTPSETFLVTYIQLPFTIQNLHDIFLTLYDTFQTHS